MDIKNYIKLLQLNNLFKDFTYEDIASLFNVNNHFVKEYQKNSMIHFESEKCLFLDIILKGELLVQRIDEHGSVLTITQFNVGDTIGANLLFGHNTAYPMTIISKSNVVMLHVHKDLVLDLCQRNKTFLVEFIGCVSDKTFILTNKIKSITMKSLRDSIIDYLNYEYYSQNSTKIKLNITKKELAERLGVQRTSLSRELNKMRQDGIIQYNASWIKITDLEILK